MRYAIEDRSDPDILEEIAERVRSRLPADRYVHLVLENDKNQARYLARADQGRPRHYVAQWNDDIHHAMHVLLTGEARGYYADYANAPARHLARCLSEGFAYQNDPSEFRAGERRGEVSKHLPPTAFVSFLQNHDQIGNRAFGERLAVLSPRAAVRAGLALLLLAPSIPLLFMGEEWQSTRPFLFFCDLGESLRDSVREGAAKSSPPFPSSPTRLYESVSQTRRRRAASKPASWTGRPAKIRRTAMRWRRPPSLDTAEAGHHTQAARHDRPFRTHRVDRGRLSVGWRLDDGALLTVVANLAQHQREFQMTRYCHGNALFRADPAGGKVDRLEPWTVIGSSAARTRRRDGDDADSTIPELHIRSNSTKTSPLPIPSGSPYLARLGVSHVYASPYLKAQPAARTDTILSIIMRSTRDRRRNGLRFLQRRP